MASPANREEVTAKRAAVIGAMVSSLKRAESREYHVGVVGYYIEGIPYSATGLSVGPTQTLDINLTDEGWRKLTLRWALFFLALAVLNEIVWRTQSTDFWVAFKVFGVVPITFVFAALQVPLMTKYAVAGGTEAEKK